MKNLMWLVGVSTAAWIWACAGEKQEEPTPESTGTMEEGAAADEAQDTGMAAEGSESETGIDEMEGDTSEGEMADEGEGEDADAGSEE